MREMTNEEKINFHLGAFVDHAKKRGLDLRGDALRFFSIKTARAWTAWLRKAI